jgi:hypothetical protein
MAKKECLVTHLSLVVVEGRGREHLFLLENGKKLFLIFFDVMGRDKRVSSQLGHPR